MIGTARAWIGAHWLALGWVDVHELMAAGRRRREVVDDALAAKADALLGGRAKAKVFGHRRKRKGRGRESDGCCTQPDDISIYSDFA